MKKEGVLIYFIVVVIAIFTLTSFVYAEWTSETNSAGDAIYYFYVNGSDEPRGIDYLNGVWWPSGTGSLLVYAPFTTGSRETITAISSSGCGFGCQEYGMFGNPSLGKSKSTDLKVAYTSYYARQTGLLVRTISRRPDFVFTIKQRIGTGLWSSVPVAASTNTGPDNPCIFNIPIGINDSLTANQRIAIDSQGTFYAVYKSRELLDTNVRNVLNNCQNKINSLMSGGTIDSFEWEELLEYNFEQRFGWGDGIKMIRSGGATANQETVDVSLGGNVDMPIIALDNNEKPVIVYVANNFGVGVIKMARYTGSGFDASIIDDIPIPGSIGEDHIETIAMAINPVTNNPGIIYYQARSGSGILRYLYHDGTEYTTETISSSLSLSQGLYYPGYRQPSIDFNKNGKARVSYIDDDGDLIYREKKSDGTWTSETIDTGISHGKGTFIKINESNKAHITSNRKHYYEFSLIGTDPEICGGGEDEDHDGLIDYADPDCSSLICPIPGTIKKNETGGTGPGAPWTPQVYNSSYAGCCATTQCYYYVDAGDNGCINADLGITKLVNGNLVNAYCKVNGNSAVWCKPGYINNGTGGCVLSIGGGGNEDQGGNFSKLECNINPTATYYHGFIGGRIGIISSSGGLYQSPNGTGFNKIPRFQGDLSTDPAGYPLDLQGLPASFRPTLGFYYNFSSSRVGAVPGGVLYLFNSSGSAYRTYPNDAAGNWTLFYGINKTNAGLPLNFVPTIGYYFALDGGRVHLWNSSGSIFVSFNGSQYFQVSRSGISGLPTNFIPVVGYYQNNSQSNGGFIALFNGSGASYKTANGSAGSWGLFTTTGLPSGSPTEGYYDYIRNKSVLWYGTSAYQSSNGIDFYVVNTTHLCINPSSSSCGNSNIDLGEQCDDGNTANGDGCSSTCQEEDGWDCTDEPSICEYTGLEIRRTCNDIIDQATCTSYEDPSTLTDSMKQSIQEKSLISNNFCFDAVYTFEPDTLNGGVAGDPNTCGTYVACGCYWNSTSNGGIGSCEERTFRQVTNPGLCTSTFVPLSTCIIDTDDSALASGSCIDGEGEYLINWTSSWNNGGENAAVGCVSGEKMLPCPKSTNINFFNLVNFVLAVLIIVIIYLIISNRKKRKSNDGKKKKRGKK